MQGKIVNGYTLQRLLGKGGMAEVWYAETKTGNPAAVKILNPDLALNADIAERFRNEAFVTAKLNHPNIRRVYDFEDVDGRPCMIMEYLEGDDLKDRMKQGERFSEQQLEKWWNQLVAALNYTHAQGIVHRDIKPANIFVTKDGDIKVLDFGIAKVRDSLVATQTGAQMGTLMYMSPEQICDSKHIDAKSDLYSLAVTFVHLFSGVAPYDTNSSNDFEIRESIVRKPLDLSGLPRSWQQFLTGYLDKKPENRPALVEFNGRVAKFQKADNQQIVVGNTEKVVVPGATPQQSPHVSVVPEVVVVAEPAPPAEKPKKKKRAWLWLLLGLLVAGVVIVWKYVATHPDTTHQPKVIFGTMKDQDGITYKTVKIGNQLWMAENMRAAHDRNGYGFNYDAYNSFSSSEPCYAEACSDPEYGFLYNKAAAKNVCPEGWHLPTTSEFKVLVDYCSQHYAAGGDPYCNAQALASKKGWRVTFNYYEDYDFYESTHAVSANTSRNNASGFSALPMQYEGRAAFFWARTGEDEYGVGLSLYSGDEQASVENWNLEISMPVRCIHD